MSVKSKTKPKPKPKLGTKFVEVKAAHFNSGMTQEIADTAAQALMMGKAPNISQKFDDRAVATIKRIECPADCPEDQEEWKSEVSRLLGIAVFKMAKRLATETNDFPLTSIPVAMAISIDKRLLLAGQPTSFAFSMNATVNHSDLARRIRSDPAAQPSQGSGHDDKATATIDVG